MRRRMDHKPDIAQTSPMGRFVTCPGGAAVALATGLLAVLLASSAEAARIVVGPTGDVATLEAAINGNTLSAADTVEILPGTYTVQSMLRPLGSGAAGAPIVVRGAGMGLTIVDGSALTGSKALWDLEQDNRWWVFEDLTVSGMRGSQTNARGFFLVACEDVVLQRVEVTDCWNGIMSASHSKRLTLQYSNIHHCGGLQGPAHNVYMNSGEDFIIQHNWLHDAQYGMCYKDRTHNLIFRYNWVENADIEGYEISLAGDGSADQGETLFLGNVFVKSPSSVQQTHFIRFENGRTGTFRLVHNTLVAQPNNVVISSIASTTFMENNIVDGGKSLWSSGSWSAGQNWLDEDLEVPLELAAALRGVSPGFHSAPGGDYSLAAGSVCIDAGAAVSQSALYQWGGLGLPLVRGTTGAAADLGAFEYQASISVNATTWSGFKERFRAPQR